MPFPDSFYRWRPHPWHGLEAGTNPPEIVNAYIEITPFDHVKYEIDKKTGYLVVDRPNRTSSHPPSLYGFVPRTYCGKRVAALMERDDVKGDRDPLDICVLSERPIARADIILEARVLGGLPMIDGGEADDKIIAVLKNDYVFSDAGDISDLPNVMIERLHHYFTTYKIQPGKELSVEIGEAYGKEHAQKVIRASMQDYQERYGEE
ncbi:MAG: inorganic pyrophosphatase [Proteobacteria bacterium]|nr:inorganic pyrophosphatase [Pseudomonadota bacterium]